jgi:hypothetical protein
MQCQVIYNLDFLIFQDEVVARDEGIRREYNELDTLWFMAGSLFQVLSFDLPKCSCLWDSVALAACCSHVNCYAAISF